MKMNKKALLSSALTIVLCLSLIAGSTFALFTSQTDVSIAVDAGRVNIQAGLTQPTLYSVDPIADGETATEYDENGKGYIYEKQDVTFANGGTAVLGDRVNEDGTVTPNGIITLTNITPGDKIEFNLTGSNTSDVAVQYRYKFDVIDGYDLMVGCNVIVNGTKYASLATYTSEWNELLVGADIPEVKLALELPVSAGNEYQELDAQVKVSVEAVQRNADVSDTDAVSVKYITTADDATELISKINADEYLHIFLEKDVEGVVEITKSLKDKTIDANGNELHLSFKNGVDENGNTKTTVLENVVVTHLNTKTINIDTGVSGDISILDSNFTSNVSLGAAGYNAFISGRGNADLDITVDGCTFDGQGVVGYAVYFMNISNVTVRNCEIKNTKSWAIQANGSGGNAVVSDCKLTNCVGILKAGVKGGAGSGTLSGNFTFANNKMVDCTTKNNFFIDIDLDGTLTFSNNTMNDVVVTPEDMLGIKISQ